MRLEWVAIGGGGMRGHHGFAVQNTWWYSCFVGN